MPQASVIIVTYNGLRESTIPCLESIFKESGNENYEVIVVDNNSSDGTQEYLTELAGREVRLRYVFNKTNRGFAGGNNDGIAAASGKVLVLLNNDTQVSQGWLSGLCKALQGDGSIGLVGPVSNEVGNEQKIFTSGRNPVEILAEGACWVRHSTGDAFDTQRLGFFCVALRRDLVDNVGLLDESFGLGFYEDDDYCLRVARAGYRLVCIEDVFVYHRGSASFDKTPALTRQLLRKNLRLLEAKIGHRYRPTRPRNRQLALIEGYLETVREHGEVRLIFKAANRADVLCTMAPRGFCKKTLFGWKMKSIRLGIDSIRKRVVPAQD